MVLSQSIVTSKVKKNGKEMTILLNNYFSFASFNQNASLFFKNVRKNKCRTAWERARFTNKKVWINVILFETIR